MRRDQEVELSNSSSRPSVALHTLWKKHSREDVMQGVRIVLKGLE